MNVMIMAGTQDAIRIIKKSANLEDIKIIATATTSYGAELARSAGAHDVISEALSCEKIVDTVNERNINVIVDATHPFAVEATKNAIKAAHKTKIKYLRFERPQTPLPETELICKVQCFEDAASKAIEMSSESKKKVMHLAGVSTLHYLTEVTKPHRIIARVIPSPFSIKKCLEMGLPPENIIAMQGTFSKEFNKSMMKEYNVSAVVTKESGEVGGTPQKVEASIELGIPAIVVMRPNVAELENEKVSSDIDIICRDLMEL